MMMDPAVLNDDAPPPYDGPATIPEYSPSKSLLVGEIDVKAHQELLAREESIFLPARLKRTSLWPSPSRVLSSAVSVCRRVLSIWAPQVNPAPAPSSSSSEDRLEIALADASAKSRMMHLLALFVAMICDSEVSASSFDAADFCERWQEPCIARLRGYQDSGVISSAISEEVDIFCEFMNSAAIVIPVCNTEEGGHIANLCWAAMNENNFHKLHLSSPALQMLSLSSLNARGADSPTPPVDDTKHSSLKRLDIAAGLPSIDEPPTRSPGPSTADTKFPSLDKLNLVTKEIAESGKSFKLDSSSSLSSPSSTSCSHQSTLRSAHHHIRSIMSNVLGEFSALISEDNLDLEDFRGRWYEPAVVQILDAMQEGVLQSEETLRRDASSWLRFLRAAMASLEQDAKSNVKGTHEYDAPGGSRDEILRWRREETRRLRGDIAAKGRIAYFSGDYDALR